jgi:D-alanyl-D-alanine carboxypeptidase (penicillin-binding protein 5/6)
MFIDTTMQPTVDELLKGMIVQSGNDASVALAEGTAGSLDGFVGLMNRQAQAWGLKNTAFKNVTGLTEAGHYSSARDISVIASHIIRDFPERYPYYSMKEYTFNKIRQDNRNLLLRRDPSVDGMKTGYTDGAGYCLVASAQRDFPNGKRRLLSVVLGAAPRRPGRREPEAAELGLHPVRCGPSLRRQQAGGHGQGVEGRQARGRPGRSAGCGLCLGAQGRG